MEKLLSSKHRTCRVQLQHINYLKKTSTKTLIFFQVESRKSNIIIVIKGLKRTKQRRTITYLLTCVGIYIYSNLYSAIQYQILINSIPYPVHPRLKGAQRQPAPAALTSLQNKHHQVDAIVKRTPMARCLRIDRLLYHARFVRLSCHVLNFRFRGELLGLSNLSPMIYEYIYQPQDLLKLKITYFV